MVPPTGIEPVQCCHRGILSPLRLPIPPWRPIILEYYNKLSDICQVPDP